MENRKGWFARLISGQANGGAGVPTTPFTSGSPGVAAEAERLCTRAAECRQAGDNDHAVVLYERALQLNPRLVHAWINLGILLREIWRPRAALACLEQAQRLAGGGDGPFSVILSQLVPLCRDEAAAAVGDEEAEVWLRRGYTAEKDGHWEHALDYYDHARFLNPKNPRAFILPGSLLLRSGRDAEAMQMFEQARRLNDPETNALLTRMFPA